MGEMIVRLDTDGRVVATTEGKRGIPQFADAVTPLSGPARRLFNGGAPDWSPLLIHGGGVGEVRVVGHDGAAKDMVMLIQADEDGWVVTMRSLDRPAREPGVVRNLPALLDAWRAAERALADGRGDDAALGEEVARLAQLYQLLSRATAAA